jgi:hypothetical protein
MGNYAGSAELAGSSGVARVRESQDGVAGRTTGLLASTVRGVEVPLRKNSLASRSFNNVHAFICRPTAFPPVTPELLQLLNS